jgi:hypothetical protein
MKYLGRYLSRLLGKSLTRLFLSLPACVRDITVAWWKDLNNIQVGTETVSGLMEFDGVDDEVVFSGTPDITGNRTVSFKLYIKDVMDGGHILYIGDSGSQCLSVRVLSNTLRAYALRDSTSHTIRSYNVDYTSPSPPDLETGVIYNIQITKTSTDITSFVVNGVDNSTSFPTSQNISSTGFSIGSIGGTNLNNNFHIWDINIDGNHAYTGQPNGNQDSAWVDTIGSIDGTVNGSPEADSISADCDCIEESIGTRIDTVYYGQYLDATSGQINFYRTGSSAGTFDYTDPSDGSLVEGVLIPETGLYTIPANGICDIGVYPRSGGTVSGLLAFDGVDDYVGFSSIPDVTGSKEVSFKLYVHEAVAVLIQPIFVIQSSNTDKLYCEITPSNGEMRVYAGLNGTDASVTIDLTSLSTDWLGEVLNIEIIKSAGQIISVLVNGEDLATFSTTGSSLSDGFRIGGIIGTPTFLAEQIYIWDLTIGSSHQWLGQPNGNLDSAWEDIKGSIDGTVNGSPTTTSIDTGITLSYTSFYPVCERAGTVLHDVTESSRHISVATPSWSETLYGSDFLNQCGFIDKEQSDYLGYDWETEVNGSPVVLDDDTLVPLGQWSYQTLLDSEDEPLLDVNEEQILIRVND